MDPARLYKQSRDLLEGTSVARDEAQAFALVSAAAATGYRDAVLAMGWHYLNGVGVPRDVALAKEWYQKSARQKEGLAMFSLGQIACAEGAPEEAMTWFQRASDQGHTLSLFCMAKLYWRGTGVHQNRRMAELILQQAVARKDPTACRVSRLLSWSRRRR